MQCLIIYILLVFYHVTCTVYKIYKNEHFRGDPFVTERVRSRMECASKCDVTASCIATVVPSVEESQVTCQMYESSACGNHYELHGTDIVMREGKNGNNCLNIH